MAEIGVALSLPDVANQEDARRIPIPRVGVRGVQLPVQIAGRSGRAFPTVASVDFAVSLHADKKGTHMSRLMQILDDATQYPLNLSVLQRMLDRARDMLDADRAEVTMRFKYFLRKHAPITGATGWLDADVEWVVMLENGHCTRLVRVNVPVKSLCPCSKQIALYGAHNQRAYVRAEVELLPATHDIDVDELCRLLEEQGSSPLYPVLKRPDEKHVTESAYDNAKFVEDMLRDSVLALRRLPGIRRFKVECESVESIHNHNAFAATEEWLSS
ncbi:MAG: GTP cyclohydrolase FolE2 [Armatimonadota bacterium]|nr:GTP cyclohydrolase FolE2 [bacterium]MDW8322305.1 GTP cyclohydrolase FolE2 [Armatimonadota bacterium]